MPSFFLSLSCGAREASVTMGVNFYLSDLSYVFRKYPWIFAPGFYLFREASSLSVV